MRLNHPNRFAVSTAALLLTLTSCAGAQTSAIQESSDSNSASTSTVANTQNPSVDTAQSQAVQPNSDNADPQANGIAQASGTAQETSIAQTPSESYGVQTLNATELATIEAELGDSETFFSDHSFALDLPDLGGEVAFVASRAERENDPYGALVMRLRSPNGDYEPLVPDNQIPLAWHFRDLKAISFEDINGDGIGPDIVAIAEYMTGAGPEAAQPFPVVTIHFKDAEGLFAADAAINEQLNEQGITTIEQVRQQLASGR